MTHARFRSGVAVVAGSERPAAAPGSGGRSLGRVAASGSAASGSTPLSRSALGVRAAAGAAEEGREVGRLWAGVRACGRGGGREAARAAGAEVGAAAAAGEGASPWWDSAAVRRDAASEGTRVNSTPPSRSPSRAP